MSAASGFSEDGPTNLVEVDHRQQILATELPERVLARIRGRSRVAVRNVGDLILYLSIIEPLCATFQHYKGNRWFRLPPSDRVSSSSFLVCTDHELAISELLHITMNRLTEWRRVWKLARRKGAFRNNMSLLYQHSDISVAEFVSMLNNMKKVWMCWNLSTSLPK